MIDPPLIDPAWFYSSLAQSSAAVVGLMGGVLGGRIINHLIAMHSLRNSLVAQLRQVVSSIHNARSYEVEFIAFAEGEIGADQKAIEAGDEQRVVSSGQTWHHGSWSGGQRAIEPKEDRERMSVQRDAAQLIFKALQPLPGGHLQPQMFRELAKSIGSVRDDTALRATGLNLSSFVNGMESSLGRAADEFESFRRQLAPIPFILVAFAITWMLILGLAWPLSVLPGVPGSSSKFWMLLALVIGLIALCGYFWFQIFELWRLGRIEIHQRT